MNLRNAISKNLNRGNSERSTMTLINTELSKDNAINPIKSTNYVELIRALTPIAIAIIGCIIGVSAILSHDIDSNKLTAAMGLAGTAMAGASGLAQFNKNE